jgi:hypothetical protein
VPREANVALSLRSRDAQVLVPDRLLEAMSVLLGIDPYGSRWRVDPRDMTSMREAVRAEIRRVHTAHVDAVGGTEPWRAEWLGSRLRDDEWYVLLRDVADVLASSEEVTVLGD